MKINFISFLDPTIYFGGGEMISRALLVEGKKRGHDIRISSVRPSKIYVHEKPDLVFFCDIFNNAHSYKSLGAWRAFDISFIKSQIKSTPFIHMTNAYVDLCNLPYLPCNGSNSEICEYKKMLSFPRRILMKDNTNKCFTTRQIVRDLYQKSILNIYLSPLHQKVSESLLGLPVNKCFVLKPIIDKDKFYNMHLDRDIEYLFVGIIGEAKGLNEIREKYKEKNIHFIGKIAPGIDLDFGTYHGHVDYTEIPKFMNRAKRFVFFPRWPEPQGRVVVEAALCGCEIIGNENVGALSFPMNLSDANNYLNVEADFWEEIENLKI
ncbi:glycosyltransferase [Pedobacter glucosidilyticus]|uniref:glycosyltransferase n=1 Tax=Pedobacter glucosidilyticus TaxID=1122941 RepID=UPI000402FAAF|nr:glycosyltransferase [Pedobacter glucosidilyticus]